eukprot:40493-Chlamydomonas_euryale.AAC.5
MYARACFTRPSQPHLRHRVQHHALAVSNAQRRAHSHARLRRCQRPAEVAAQRPQHVAARRRRWLARLESDREAVARRRVHRTESQQRRRGRVACAHTPARIATAAQALGEAWPRGYGAGKGEGGDGALLPLPPAPWRAIKEKGKEQSTDGCCSRLAKRAFEATKDSRIEDLRPPRVYMLQPESG